MRARLGGGARDERGAVAVIFAVSIVLLAPLALGIVDVYMSISQRSRLQDALDAAALYTARSTATDPDEIAAIGLRALKANLSAADQARLVNSSFVLTDSTIQASAEISSDSIASELWNHGDMSVSTNVVRSSVNLEVSLVLDITGSMSGDMDSLKSAADDLIDLVVQDTQTPYYSKLAIVPYSNAVNVGSYVDAARGPLNIPTITGATRTKSSGTYYITFTTAAPHGLSSGDTVRLSDVGGYSSINTTWQVQSTTLDTFKIKYGSSNPGNYTSGGLVHCYNYGCENYTFTNASWGTTTYPITSCVTERTGTYKYSDTAPSTAYVGLNYSNSCPSATMMPLSTDKTALKAKVTTLSSGGSTAGHIGISWGWYTISPNFGYLWSDANSRPAAYGTDELLKVAILMTDGEFNTAYCDGVVAKDSGSGSGNSNTHINCNATNGSSITQAEAVCDAMKDEDIIIYTVGFRISSGSTAANLLAHCATDSDHQYLPASGVDLQDAFQAIGQDINSLRLSH